MVAAEIRAAGGTAMTLDFDLTSLDSIKQGVAAALKEFGKIDVLVNNAGITRDGAGHAHEAGRLAAGPADQPDRRVPRRPSRCCRA